MRSFLAIDDPEIRARWREGLLLLGHDVESAPASPLGAAFAVVDAAGLRALHRAGRFAGWVLGLYEEPEEAEAMLVEGADDLAFSSGPLEITTRLRVAERAVARGTAEPGAGALLRAVGEACMRVRERERLLETVCQLAVAHGFLGAWIGQVDADRRVREAARAGAFAAEAAPQAVADRLLGAARPRSREITRAVDPAAPALVALPLRAARRMTGALVLRPGAASPLGPAAIPLLEDLATDLSMALELIEDESRRLDAATALRARERTQAALAHLALRALEAGEPEQFVHETVEVIAAALQTELCQVQRLDVGRTLLVSAAAHGFGEAPLPDIPAGDSASPGAFALGRPDPVLVERYAEDLRFGLSEALQRAGAVAGVHVAVPGQAGPLGVLSVATIKARRFHDDEVHFLQTVAATVGGVIERGRAHEALRRSEQTFRNLIESSPDAIFVMDGERFVFVNRTMAALLGRPVGSWRQVPLEAVVHPDDVARVRERFDAVRAQGGPNPLMQVRLVRAGGELVLAESVSMRVDYDGVACVMGIARDIGERQAMQDKMVMTERLAAVGTLAAGVAHEINNPLAYVVANLSFLAEELEAKPGAVSLEERVADMREALGEAQEGAQRVRTIVKDLKTFSRGDEERLGPVDVREVLESTLHLAANEIRHRARLVRELGAVPNVEANAGRLGQVFLNLLVNAAQALPEDGRAHEVRVVTRTEGGNAVVEVHDSGVGISPELRARIFDPFFTTKPVGVGTGLGLSICHGIVTRLGGALEVSSEVGRGSCFRVVLPGTGAAPAVANVAQPAAPGRRGLVLVVDDEPMVCASIRRALREEHEVVAVNGGLQALEQLRSGAQFDLILCDLLMPEMSGMDLYAELARSAPELAARMVFLSGGAFTARARAFVEDPQRTCLEKPFEVEKLRELVRSRLTGSG